MTDELQPDPSYIGGVAKAPFAIAPDPVALFQTRAKRFAFLAQGSELEPYLRFLGDLTRLQARLVVTTPAPAAPSAGQLALAREAGMPALNRPMIAQDDALAATLDAFLEGAAEIDMPDAARQALDAVRAADAEDRRWLLDNVLADEIAPDMAAPHLFAALAAQVHMARLAATLDAAALTPVSIGVCPACGGRPATSSVMAAQDIENIRYAACACCATQWNEVRVKCLACGSTKGVTYRSAETDDAAVKAECCRECNSWTKIFYKAKNHSLEPIADDVVSLGLDMLMKDTQFRRAGFNPMLAGY